MFSSETEEYLQENIFYDPPKDFTEENIESLFDGLLTMTEDNGAEKEFPTTADHSVRTAVFASCLAGRMGEDKDLMFKCGLLHDIGKMEIKKDTLYKKGRFTAEERALVSRHGKYTENLLVLTFGASLPDKVRHACANHHKADTDVFDNILYVSDQLEALTSAKRTYKEPKTAKEALDIIKNFNGGALPEVYEEAEKLMTDLEKYKKEDKSYDVEAICPECKKYMDLIDTVTIPKEMDKSFDMDYEDEDYEME